MNFLEITLSNRTMLILGAVSGIAIIIFITFLIAKRYNKKSNAIK